MLQSLFYSCYVFHLEFRSASVNLPTLNSILKVVAQHIIAVGPDDIRNELAVLFILCVLFVLFARGEAAEEAVRPVFGSLCEDGGTPG